MPFSLKPIIHSPIRAVKNRTYSFGFEALDQDTVKERYEGLDGFKRSLGNSSLCIIIIETYTISR